MNHQKVIEALSVFLSNTYALYLKTQNFHWNVTGPHFHSLHGMFEEQYTELATAVDDIAERIRAVGAKAPGSFADFLKLTQLTEAHGDESAETMVKQLAQDHATVMASARSAMSTAEQAEDGVTVSFLDERLSVHEKTAWMLRSSAA